MKRPVWVKTIGIICIILGLFRFFSALQYTLTPHFIDQGKQLLDLKNPDTTIHVKDTIGPFRFEYNVSNDSIKIAKEIFGYRGMYDLTLKVTDYFRIWIVRLGITGMIVMILYIFGGIALLMGRRFSLPVIYCTLGLSILYYAAFIFIILSDKTNSYMAFSTSIGRVTALLLDMGLLGWLIAEDKSYFRKKVAAESGKTI